MGNEHMVQWTMSIWLNGQRAYGSMGNEHMARLKATLALLPDTIISPYASTCKPATPYRGEWLPDSGMKG